MTGEKISKTISLDFENYILLEMVCTKKNVTKSEFINSLLTDKFKNIDKTKISEIVNDL